MGKGATYKEVAQSGCIKVRHLDHAEVQAPWIQDRLKQSRINLASRMSGYNKPLEETLINLFKNVEFEVFKSADQVRSGFTLRRTLIFTPKHPDIHYEKFTWLDKPHMGALVLHPGPGGKLYVPVPAKRSIKNVILVPYILNLETIGGIRGRVGREILKAFKQGNQNILIGKSSNARYLRDEARKEVDTAEMATVVPIKGRSSRPREIWSKELTA